MNFRPREKDSSFGAKAPHEQLGNSGECRRRSVPGKEAQEDCSYRAQNQAGDDRKMKASPFAFPVQVSGEAAEGDPPSLEQQPRTPENGESDSQSHKGLSNRPVRRSHPG